MKRFWFLLFVSSVCCQQFSETPEYILPCSRTDPGIDGCIANTINHLRPYLAKGIPEINVPSVEPLNIHKLQIENGNGAIRVKAVFQNITVYGISNYSISNVRSNISALRIDLAAGVPRLEVTGRYDINGKVLLLPVKSKGEFWCAFDDVSGAGRVYGKEVRNNNEVYMKADKMIVDFKVKKARFRVKSKIGGSNVLEEAINNFLNNNAEAIIEEMKQPAIQSIGKYFRNVLNSALLRVPLRIWLHD